MPGLVGSVMERIFGNVPAQVAPPSGVNQPGQPLPQTQQTQQTDPNGLVPKVEPTKEKSPLDGLEKLWETPTIDTSKEPKGLFEGLDHKKVLETAQKNDFAKLALTPEILQAAAKGGQEGVAALVSAMNGMSQQVYAQSAIATTQIVEQALAKQQEKFMAALPGIVKNSTSREAMIGANPMLAHPAVAPIAEALQVTFLKKNPNATSQEISLQVADAISKLGEAFGPKPVKTEAEKKAAAVAAKSDFDWDSLLTGSGA